MILSYIYIWINMILMYGYRYLNIETYKIWLKRYYILFIDILIYIYIYIYYVHIYIYIMCIYIYILSVYHIINLGIQDEHGPFGGHGPFCFHDLPEALAVVLVIVLPPSYSVEFAKACLIGVSCGLPSSKLTVRPWHSSGLED